MYQSQLVKIETSGGPDLLCRSEGTGFVVGRSGPSFLILTAAHVIPDAPECAGSLEIIGRWAMRPDVELPLTVLSRSGQDVAILRGELGAAGPMPGYLGGLCDPHFGRPGAPIDSVVFIGYFPGDLTPLPYDGHIETNPSPDDVRQRIQGSVNRGLSGGPVINHSGLVVGMMRERIDTDIYGESVVGKAYITPVTVLQRELASVSVESVSPVQCSARLGSRYYDWNPGHFFFAWDRDFPPIVVPLQVSEINADHQPAPTSDILDWSRRRLLGQNPSPLRYPKTYERRFSPQPGYRFDRVLETRVLSHNRPAELLPTSACLTRDDCIYVAADGSELVIRFRLWSGPIIDQTRGWLDMIILTEQTRLR